MVGAHDYPSGRTATAWKTLASSPAVGSNRRQGLASSFVDHQKDREPEAMDAPRALSTEEIATIYETFYGEYGHFVGHYMETLTTTLQLIDQQGHGVDTSRQVYANIVSAQLSVPERAVLFYHCRTGEPDEPLRLLIEKYGVL